MPLLDTLIDLICYLYLPDQAAIIAGVEGGAAEPRIGLAVSCPVWMQKERKEMITPKRQNVREERK